MGTKATDKDLCMASVTVTKFGGSRTCKHVSNLQCLTKRALQLLRLCTPRSNSPFIHDIATQTLDCMHNNARGEPVSAPPASCGTESGCCRNLLTSADNIRIGVSSGVLSGKPPSAFDPGAVLHTAGLPGPPSHCTPMCRLGVAGSPHCTPASTVAATGGCLLD